VSALDKVLAAAGQPVTTAAPGVDPDRFALAAGEDPESSGDDLGDEDQSDWNEDDWDDVRSHLEQESPWFKRVMNGESPGDPDQIPSGWADRGKELAGGELSRILLTPRTAEASTVHEPTVPPGGPGLFRIKGRELPPYVQHLYKHLVGKYGKHRAYGVAIGIVKKWAAGVNPGGKGKGHKVHADVQAAAAKNVADWETSRGMAHGHHAAKEAAHDDKAAASNVALAVVHAYDREVQGRLERVNNYIKNDRRVKVGVIGPESPVAKNELLGLYHSSPEAEAAFRGHLREAREHYAAGRHEQAIASLGRAQDVAKSRSLGFTADALERQKAAILEEQRAAAAKRAAAAAPVHAKGGFLGRFGHHAPVAASQPASPLDVVLAAPASWPSGRPYKESLLPPGPTTSLLAGLPTRTGVITNAPGSAPVRYGQLRQAPSQTVAASPPLPTGVTLPTAGELDTLAAQVPDGADITLSNSVRTHLRTAAEKMRKDDRNGALSALRSAQAGVHSAYRAAIGENMPVTAQVYGSFTAVPPAAQSSATTAMLAGRATTDKYRALHHQIALNIDRFRREYFGGQVNQVPDARLSSGLMAHPSELLTHPGMPAQRPPPAETGDIPARLLRRRPEVAPYRRTEHGREELVGGYERLAREVRGAASEIPHAWGAHLRDAASHLDAGDGRKALNSLLNARTEAAVRGDPIHERIMEHIRALRPHVVLSAGEDLVLAFGRSSKGAEEVLDPGHVKGYARENRFGRIVNVTGYVREGKPYSGKLTGDDADDAIRAGVAKGEYGEPTGYFQTSDGKRMWGWHGAAGLLVRHTDPQTGEKRYLLQKRASWVDSPNTYSIPGGAMDHVNGVPETPDEAADREAREELGRELPAGTRTAEVRTKTFGEGKGAWSYHTVVKDTPRMFDPEGEGQEGVHDTRHEAKGYVWATPEEMAHLPLHPHFRGTAEDLGMPAGGGAAAPQLSRSAASPELALARVREVAGANHR
jgi:8-oxo-dGTP diphosphatase